MSDQKSETLANAPVIGEEQVRLLERLCNACAVSGDEQEVRLIVLEQLGENLPRKSSIKVDALGNVLVTCLGTGPQRLRVMLAAHMDEVGLMLTHDEEKGILRFDTVGGLDVRQLAGKLVLVGREHIPGVIGAKPIHLTKKEELKQAISLDTLRVDVGPSNASKVKVGDRATFATSFSRVGPSLRAKALDDRLGVATLIELVKHAPANIDLLAAFTVQEEVGLRGARVAAYTLDPHLAIALDSTPAYDLPVLDQQADGRLENTRVNSRLGGGPAIYPADRSTISDPRLVRHLVRTAEKMDIPFQIRQPGGGGTDAGAIHMQRAGVPSVSLSVPGRYAHTAAGIARFSDWANTLALAYHALAQITPEILAQED
jgi:putative aminopeptidase FrvX